MYLSRGEASRASARFATTAHLGTPHTDVSEALTPEEETIETDLAETADEDVPVDDEYDGPDPEDDPTGDGSDEDQGT